jgi:phosphoribosylaminoimidazole (AIR) synthetase
MVVVVAPEKADAAADVLRREGETVARLGEVIVQGEARVVYDGRLGTNPVA